MGGRGKRKLIPSSRQQELGSGRVGSGRSQESAGESCVRGSTQKGAAAPHTHWLTRRRPGGGTLSCCCCCIPGCGGILTRAAAAARGQMMGEEIALVLQLAAAATTTTGGVARGGGGALQALGRESRVRHRSFLQWRLRLTITVPRTSPACKMSTVRVSIW